MLFSSFVILGLSASVIATPSNPQVVASQLTRRAGQETSSSFLANILGLASGSCVGPCNVATADYSQCANQTNNANVANCACSAQSLGDLRTCASCIAEAANATIKATAVSNYNSFVDLCVKDGLASVTGTVSVGQSTSAIPRASSTTTSSATRATYTTGASTSVAAVPTLVGSSTSSTATGTAASAGQTAAPASGANQVVTGSALALLAGALALLA